MTEPWNSMALVVVGSALGAWAVAAWCDCWARWRWRRRWRALAERNGRDFCESGSCAARFLAESSQRRMEERARRLKEVAK